LLKHQVYVAEEVHKWQQYSENLQAKIAVYQEQYYSSETMQV